MDILKILLKQTADKKAVLLDLDNTLYAYDPCHATALGHAYRRFRKLGFKLTWSGFLGRYGKAREMIHRRLKGQAASHSRFLYFQTMMESLEGRTNFQIASALDRAYWQSFIKKMELFPWVMPFLKEMKRREKSVILVTNLTSAIQYEKVRVLKLGKWIRAIVTSEEAGIEKPDLRIFTLALSKTGLKPGQVLVIGDHPREDSPRGFRSLILRSAAQ